MKRVSDVAYEATLTALECGASMLSTRSAELRRNGRPERAGTYARHAAEFRNAKAGLEHGTTSGGGDNVSKDIVQDVISQINARSAKLARRGRPARAAFYDGWAIMLAAAINN